MTPVRILRMTLYDLSVGRALAGQCGCGSVGTAGRDEVPRRPGSTGYTIRETNKLYGHTVQQNILLKYRPILTRIAGEKAF